MSYPSGSAPMSVVGIIIDLRKKEETMEVSVEKLIEMKVLRKSIFSDGDWYVIYTEDGAKDVSLIELTSN